MKIRQLAKRSSVNRNQVLVFLLLSMAWLVAAGRVSANTVALIRVPDAGIQPQVALDGDKTVHLVYFRGDPAHGNLFYTRSSDGGVSFTKPIRVNSQDGDAVAVGNIRGARIALGRKGHLYVVWNGSQQAAAGHGGKTPLFYTRLNRTGTAFEPERNLIQFAYGIDGGSAVAADQKGHVYVLWHAPTPGQESEGNRRVWMVRSSNDGISFQRERPAWNQLTGVCGCCSLDAFADSQGELYVLYRAATNIVHRDMYLLKSADHGLSFSGADISKWNVSYCVMSAESFAQGPAGTEGAWEAEKQVYFERLNTDAHEAVSTIAPPGAGNNRKYPSITENAKGQTLLAWTEGMGWKRGGSLHWQVFDEAGRPVGNSGQAGGVPVWSTVAAYTRKDGTFAIVY